MRDVLIRSSRFSFVSLMIRDPEKKGDREKDGRRVDTSSISKWFHDNTESIVFQRQTESGLGIDFVLPIRFGDIAALFDDRHKKTTPQTWWWYLQVYKFRNIWLQ